MTTVRCPACDTTYRLPPAARRDVQPTFRCSRCDHVFGTDDDLPPRADDRLDHVETMDAPGELDDDITPPAARSRSATRFALRTAVGVTLVFGLLSIYVYVHRSRVAEALLQVPFIGPGLSVTQLDPRHIQLTDVRGEYARAGGDALVFVITGSAVNNAPEPVSAIQIRGSIVGAKEQDRLVYAGAVPHDVHDLSTHEIDLLQTLEPPRDWRLLPGEDGDFLVAFVDPPLPLREFRVEVASVRHRTSPARPE